VLCFEHDQPRSAQEENLLLVDARSHTQGESLPTCLVANALPLRKGRSWISLRLGQSMVFSLVMHLSVEHIVCSILKLTKLWRLVRHPSTRHSHVVSLSLIVQVMMNLARRSFRRRSMNMKMMNMAVWCPRLSTYILLRPR
jgi:hypothetical protein